MEVCIQGASASQEWSEHGGRQQTSCELLILSLLASVSCYAEICGSVQIAWSLGPGMKFWASCFVAAPFCWAVNGFTLLQAARLICRLLAQKSQKSEAIENLLDRPGLCKPASLSKALLVKARVQYQPGFKEIILAHIFEPARTTFLCCTQNARHRQRRFLSA